MPLTEKDGQLFFSWSCEVLVDGAYPREEEELIEEASASDLWKSAWRPGAAQGSMARRGLLVAAGLVDPSAATTENGCSRLTVAAALRELRGSDELWRVRFSVKIDDANVFFESAQRTQPRMELESAEEAGMSLFIDAFRPQWLRVDEGLDLDEWPDDDTSPIQFLGAWERLALLAETAPPKDSNEDEPTARPPRL